MIDIQIRGAEEFGVLSRRLKEAGDKGLRKELYAGLNRAAQPAKAAVRPNVLAEMPKRGHLAEFLSSSTKVTQSNRGAGRNPGVTIRSKSPHNIRKIDKGNLRHPVFGSRKVWVAQAVPAGAFTDPIKERAPEMRVEMERTIRAVAAKLERPL
jgi:hypothetical protein